MHLCIDAVTTEIAGLEAIPGMLTVIGLDEAGQLLESSRLSPRSAFYLTARMRRMEWHPIGVESAHGEISVVYGKRCAGRTCLRCAGLGLIPYYAHIDNGRCFTCHGTGRPQKDTRAPWRLARTWPR